MTEVHACCLLQHPEHHTSRVVAIWFLTISISPRHNFPPQHRYKPAPDLIQTLGLDGVLNDIYLYNYPIITELDGVKYEMHGRKGIQRCIPHLTST
jgi:hypothetical protein